MTPVCYLDLDGVLVDFVTGALAFHGKSLPPSEVRWDFAEQVGFDGPDGPARFWNGFGRQFWADLDWTHEGRELLAGVCKLFGTPNVVLLSSPCATPGCRDGKADWVKAHCPELAPRLFLGAEKAVFAGPHAVLVDDRQKTVEEYVRRGGRAVLVPRPWNSRKALCDEQGCFVVPALLEDVKAALEAAGGHAPGSWQQWLSRHVEE